MPRPSLDKAASTPVKSKSTPKATPKSAKATPTSKSTPKAKASKGKAPAKLYSSFLPIPLDLPFPVASSSKSKASATHYIFVRPHASKSPLPDDQERAARTLFAANIPVDAGEHDLRTLFGNWGVVESIQFSGGSSGNVLESAVAGLPEEDESDDESQGEEEEEQQEQQGEDGWTFVGTAAKESRKRRRKPAGLPPSVPEVTPLDLGRSTLGQSGGRTAQIVFLDPVSVSRAMGYSGPSLPLALKSPEVGLTGYEARYASLRPPLAVVRAHADTAMARHDHLHSMLLASRAKQHGAGALVDEDGFTVVVRGGRYGRTAGRGGAAGVGVAGRAATKAALEKKKSRGAAELKDFYRFQSVDRKRKELADMRARFDEDRKKVEDLKRQRRFKPY